MKFGLSIRPRIIFKGQGQQPGQTSLNNPDFSEFPGPDDSPDGTYGWIEEVDPGGVSISLAEFRDFFIIYAGGALGASGDIIYSNTAQMRGGLVYDVNVMAHGFNVPFSFDAFVNDVAQGVGGSDTIDDNTLDYDTYFPYGGQIDASSITGTFIFKIIIHGNVFDQFNIRSINLTLQ